MAQWLGACISLAGEQVQFSALESGSSQLPVTSASGDVKPGIGGRKQEVSP